MEAVRAGAARRDRAVVLTRARPSGPRLNVDRDQRSPPGRPSTIDRHRKRRLEAARGTSSRTVETGPHSDLEQAPDTRKIRKCGPSRSGRYWARTSDLRLV